MFTNLATRLYFSPQEPQNHGDHDLQRQHKIKNAFDLRQLNNQQSERAKIHNKSKRKPPSQESQANQEKTSQDRFNNKLDNSQQDTVRQDEMIQDHFDNKWDNSQEDTVRQDEMDKNRFKNSLDLLQEDQVSQEQKVQDRFNARLDMLHKACSLYYNSSLFRPKRAGYVPMPLYRPVMNISVRYCPIAKTSATTWTVFFAGIRDHMRKRHVEGSEERSKADDEIHFTFVREPYSRMLSGYVDKLLTPNALFWWITGRFVVRKFRPNATMNSLKCGHDVTFPEFVKYVVYSQQTGEQLNGHFIPTHDQCDFCTLPYRYIGHLETIKEDFPFITKAIQSPINYTRTYDSDTIVQNAKMVLWSERVDKVLKCMDRDEASRRLWRKYQIRGIISKDELFPFPRGGAANITLGEFTKTALAAHERSKKNPQLKEQRSEALKEAFADVPMQDRLAAQQTLFLDFQMFGFDPLLEDVFPSTPYVRDDKFSYFNIYD
ncbi:hypothetical protein V1264_001485 [Littorina saxatilis]|uniref:Carbohydrate sulfotransferase n=1 Tax=Littorina saxatilis TaxID=31220 RepID=A0AAN9GP74_9CAEN